VNAQSQLIRRIINTASASLKFFQWSSFV